MSLLTNIRKEKQIMATFESIKFENFERELKYLVLQNCEVTVDSLISFFTENEYRIVKKFTKEKHEIYYDDSSYSLTLSGDVMRGSNYVSEQAIGLMYKRNVSDINKPYVSKVEMGSTTYKDLNSFSDAFNLDLDSALKPMMTAQMIREVMLIEKASDMLYVSFDKVFYALYGSEKQKYYEEMLEIEDWKNPNTLHVDYSYDKHLITVNELVQHSSLPLTLTKDTKPYRGYVILKEKGEIK